MNRCFFFTKTNWNEQPRMRHQLALLLRNYGHQILFFEKPNNSVFIPKGAIHRIENPFKKIVKIIEIQLGSILKENDIVRYEDIYGRLNRH